MNSSMSAAATARFVSKILAARQTPAADVAATIDIIAATLSKLNGPLRAEATIARQQPKTAAKVATAIAAFTAAMETKQQSKLLPLVVQAILPPVQIIPEKKRRGRKPMLRTSAVIEDLASHQTESADAGEAQPASRLLRRSDVSTTTASDDAFTASLFRQATSVLKGVVKWYDNRQNKGALRLVGVAGDVMLDAAILERCGIRRLFKDQEIEAVGTQEAGHFKLETLTIPGQPQDVFISGGQLVPPSRRQSRTVFVEVKKANSKFSSARSQAERALGSRAKPDAT